MFPAKPEEKPDNGGALSARATAGHTLIADQKLFDLASASGHDMLKVYASQEKQITVARTRSPS